jgi:hypothetical protein
VIEPLYVAARDVLLDALDAFNEQREALILAGRASLSRREVGHQTRAGSHLARRAALDA